jgi:hypothetical protein
MYRQTSDTAGGGMKIAESKVQRATPNGSIFVPAAEVERVGNRNVVFGGKSFYSPAELLEKEATANGSHEREDL